MLTHITRPSVPIEALRLQEDIQALELCTKLLESLDTGNLAEDREIGYKQRRIAQATVKAMYRHAWDKMRQTYLAPVRTKIERKPKAKVKR